MIQAGYCRLRPVAMPVLAQPLLDWLRKHGVDARLSSDDAGGLHPALAFVHGVWLVVPESQRPQAEALAAQFDRSLTLIDHSFPHDDEDDPA
ncbi:MAG: hypothetical protein RIT45_4257 [Pseudomonadota bacterium]